MKLNIFTIYQLISQSHLLPFQHHLNQTLILRIDNSMHFNHPILNFKQCLMLNLKNGMDALSGSP